jgi:hypothetical protein
LLLHGLFVKPVFTFADHSQTGKRRESERVVGADLEGSAGSSPEFDRVRGRGMSTAILSQLRQPGMIQGIILEFEIWIAAGCRLS